MSDLPAGVTYRQLDYWTRAGLLHPSNGETPGSGRARRWSAHELAVAQLLGELRSAGVELPVAARLARRLADGEHCFRLTEHVTIIRSSSP